MKLNRRQFFASAGAAGLFAAGGCKGFPAITATRSPNSRVRHLSIGCGNRAWGDINELCTHPSVEMAAFCDVDAKFLAQAKAKFPKARFATGARCTKRSLIPATPSASGRLTTTMSPWLRQR